MRAILLAAGMGTRLRPLTLDTPKPLIKVNGESIIERQIKALNEIGIKDIIVVTGYLKEKFDFLRDKYGVKLIHNDKYDKYNNIYTSKDDFINLFWDDVVKNNINKMNVKLKKINEDDVYEIDSLEDLEKVKEKVEKNR